LCGGSSLLVDLDWPTSLNPRALGAQLTLYADDTAYHREVKAASGYLSGDPARIHFGFPTGTTLVKLDIRWPDGSTTTLENPQAETLVTIHRN
jgi:hypothetical protein